MELGWWSSQVDGDDQEILEEKIELSIITDVQLMFKDLTGFQDSRRLADVTSLDLRDSVPFQFGQHESTSIPI